MSQVNLKCNADYVTSKMRGLGLKLKCAFFIRWHGTCPQDLKSHYNIITTPLHNHFLCFSQYLGITCVGKIGRTDHHQPKQPEQSSWKQCMKYIRFASEVMGKKDILVDIAVRTKTEA